MNRENMPTADHPSHKGIGVHMPKANQRVKLYCFNLGNPLVFKTLFFFASSSISCVQPSLLSPTPIISVPQFSIHFDFLIWLVPKNLFDGIIQIFLHFLIFILSSDGSVFPPRVLFFQVKIILRRHTPTHAWYRPDPYRVV